MRFSFVAREPIHFAAGTSSNILRGAFGSIFRRLACLQQCFDTRTCPQRANCAYARLFEPAALAPGPSGLADWPRPFVFRATHLDGQTFVAGEPFYFDLNLFDLGPSVVSHLVLTFAQLACDGLGPGRRKVELTTVARLNERGDPCATVFQNGSLRAQPEVPPLTLDLGPARQSVARILVRFLTPLELKHNQCIAARPEFAVLAARARDRISTLRELYGDGALPIDFRQFSERAASVKMTRCQLAAIDVRRHSSRTGQVHPIGGFTGEAEYEGNLAEFLPYLSAAKWTGVGRQTVWGKGEIATRQLS